MDSEIFQRGWYQENFVDSYRISKTIVNYPNNEKTEVSRWIYDKNNFLESIITNENEDETIGIFIYDSGLLVSTEEYKNGKKTTYSLYEYEKNNNIKDILKKVTTFHANGKLKNSSEYVFENDIMIKTLNFSSENIPKYEYIHKYDDNKKKICTYRQNITEYPGQDMYYIYSTREYNKKGLLEEISCSDGANVKFIWENGFTTYDFNRYYQN